VSYDIKYHSRNRTNNIVRKCINSRELNLWFCLDMSFRRHPNYHSQYLWDKEAELHSWLVQVLDPGDLYWFNVILHPFQIESYTSLLQRDPGEVTKSMI
jgi:hypothetical protein